MGGLCSMHEKTGNSSKFWLKNLGKKV